MLQQGLIRKSYSPYAAPVKLREKPNGEWRFITDFSHINSLTVADRYPMIRIQDILKCLGNASYITTLDAEKGYWQVPMEEKSKIKQVLGLAKACTNTMYWLLGSRILQKHYNA